MRVKVEKYIQKANMLDTIRKKHANLINETLPMLNSLKDIYNDREAQIAQKQGSSVQEQLAMSHLLKSINCYEELIKKHEDTKIAATAEMAKSEEQTFKDGIYNIKLGDIVSELERLSGVAPLTAQITFFEYTDEKENPDYLDRIETTIHIFSTNKDGSKDGNIGYCLVTPFSSENQYADGTILEDHVSFENGALKIDYKNHLDLFINCHPVYFDWDPMENNDHEKIDHATKLFEKVLDNCLEKEAPIAAKSTNRNLTDPNGSGKQ